MTACQCAVTFEPLDDVEADLEREECKKARHRTLRSGSLIKRVPSIYFKIFLSDWNEQIRYCDVIDIRLSEGDRLFVHWLSTDASYQQRPALKLSKRLDMKFVYYSYFMVAL